MAYSTGTATSLAAMHTACKDACVADGWAWDAVEEVLSKGTSFIKLYVNIDAVQGDGLAILGRTSLTAGDGPYYVQIGALGRVALTFPVTYHAFTFSNEVFFIISSGSSYQYISFGKSTQPGLVGTGCYYSGSLTFNVPSLTYAPRVQLNETNASANCPAFAWAVYQNVITQNTFVHSDMDADGWVLNIGSIVAGHKPSVELLASQPNTYDMEAILLPIKVLKLRASSLYSQVMEVENARYLRNDYHPDESIITIGLDKWMVFPHLKRNTATRDGGTGHSGTLAWAIKYEGP